MKIQRKHLQYALFALVAAVVYSAWSYLTPAARQATNRPVGQEQPLLAGMQQPTSPSDVVDPLAIPAPPDVQMARTPSGGRDPFLFGNESRDMKVETVRGVTSDPFVRSILFSATRRLALVENRMVGVGDTVGGFKVASIERDAVVFTTAGGERRRVSLHGPPPEGIRR
ncbi:MAG: hypothetical protein AABY89_11405 [Acidobacteriota bacterium]